MRVHERDVVPRALQAKPRFVAFVIRKVSRCFFVGLAVRHRVVAPKGNPTLLAMAPVDVSEFAVDAETAHALRWQLAEEDRVQVPILPFAGRLWARLSAQVYNTMDDYVRLAAAVARRRTNRSQ